ncbi:hypothetical protein JW707_00980 [Candidatus Woesearchaeota archaeon]|nr:hypothetical protein [Candidatus Woesearchaeota archaeon]
MPKKVYVSVIGCNRRQLDAQRVINYFNLNKYKVIKNPKSADILVFFTCAYKQSREDKCIAEIKKLNKHKGELIVLGCLPGINEERLKKEFKGRYLSTKNLDKFDEFFPEAKTKLKDVPDTNFCFFTKPKGKHPLKNFLGSLNFQLFF